VNEQELEKYEAELRRTPPAPLPEHLMARLLAARPGAELARRTPFQPAAGSPLWPGVLRWLAPAMGLAAVVLLVGRAVLTPPGRVDKQTPAAAPGLKADGVQVDQELLSSFEVVARLPGGQPVRFRCRKWRDQLLVTDRNNGVEIEQSNPRIEVVPVRFETY